MQINFEPEKIKAAKAYVNRLNPIKVQKKSKIKTVNNNMLINKNFYTERKEKTSFIKTVLNFLFK